MLNINDVFESHLKMHQINGFIQWMNEWMFELNECLNWMNEWMNECLNWMNECVQVCRVFVQLEIWIMIMIHWKLWFDNQ